MTGGYGLLVPAALAVMLGYLVQRALTAKFRYRSLYEAQVPEPGDSPAHSADYLGVALRLMRERQTHIPDELGHVRLQALLASGVSIDLGDGRSLVVRPVSRRSSCAGRRIQECFGDASEELEIVAVFRDEHTLLVHHDLELRVGDRLLIVASAESRESLDRLLPKRREPRSSEGEDLQ